MASDFLGCFSPTCHCGCLICVLFAAAYRNLGQNLWGPHRYGCLSGVRVRTVVSGSCAAHSLLITTEGKLWSWGKYRAQAEFWGDSRSRSPTGLTFSFCAFPLRQCSLICSPRFLSF